MPPASLRGAVQVLAVLKVPAHRPHHPVEHVAGPMPARLLVTLSVAPGPPTPLLDLLQQPRREGLPARPLRQSPQPLREAPAVRSVERLPGPPGQLRERCAQLAPAAQVEPAVQEAPE